MKLFDFFCKFLIMVSLLIMVCISCTVKVDREELLNLCWSRALKKYPDHSVQTLKNYKSCLYHNERLYALDR